MYLGWLPKNSTEYCSIKVLKKSFLGPFRALEFFLTTRNDQIFLFARALKMTYIGKFLCILVDFPSKNPKTAVSKSSKKIFWVRFGFSNFFRLLEPAEFFFFLGLLKTLISAWSYVFWLICQEITRKLQYQSPQKKFFGPLSGSRIFFDYSKRSNFSFS